MEIKAMRWRDFVKYPADEQRQYLDDLRMIYKATRRNICEMLGVKSDDFRRYCKKQDLHIYWLQGKVKYRSCALSPRWLEFVRPLGGEYGIREPDRTCFAFIEGGKDTHDKCRALKRFYCVEGDCPFYRDRDEYAAEGMRIYGNKECIDQDYEAMITEKYGSPYRGWR